MADAQPRRVKLARDEAVTEPLDVLDYQLTAHTVGTDVAGEKDTGIASLDHLLDDHAHSPFLEPPPLSVREAAIGPEGRPNRADGEFNAREIAHTQYRVELPGEGCPARILAGRRATNGESLSSPRKVIGVTQGGTKFAW